MARSISWMPRLHEIRRAVASSVRSHYDRKDIEGLFQVQPRAAQLLLGMLPAMTIGRSHLIERTTLAEFLERLHQADDAAAELAKIRTRGVKASRKKVRTLVRRDVEPLVTDSLPAGIVFEPGQMVVSFRTIEDLAQAMYALARVIETDGEELARRYEVREAADEDDGGRAEFEAMLRELS